MLRTAAGVAALVIAASAFGQMTVTSDERYNLYYIEITDPVGGSDVAELREDALFGLPFYSNIGDSSAYSGSSGEAHAYQNSSITSDTISVDLSVSADADASASESVYAAGMSLVDITFSVDEPVTYELEVTRVSRLGVGGPAVWLNTADGSSIALLTGVGYTTAELAPGAYRVTFGLYTEANVADGEIARDTTSMTGSFTVSDVVPCVADLTTTGAGVGDPWYGVPDGQITGADIQYYVNGWFADDLVIADITTTGAAEGQPGYGVPDGQITGADIQYFVNQWFAGCP